MTKLFSYSYVLLVVGLMCIAAGTFIDNASSYIFLLLGAAGTAAAFAGFGNYNSVGNRGKKIWCILRYVLAAVLVLLGILFVVTQYTLYTTLLADASTENLEATRYIGDEEASLDITIRLFTSQAYSTIIIVCAIVTYLLAFKPSKTTIGKKVLKTIGYIAICYGINYLSGSNIPYLLKDSLITLYLSICFVAVGLILTFLGRRKSYNTTIPEQTAE